MLRYLLFEEYKRAVVDGRISPAAAFHFQMDNTMQGLSNQYITGKDVPFELVYRGNLDMLGVWLQTFD